MAKINKDKLEQALDEEQAPQMTKEQEVAFHQGALTTLAKEHQGLVQMLSIVESTIQAHVKGLEDLGVKVKQEKK